MINLRFSKTLLVYRRLAQQKDHRLAQPPCVVRAKYDSHWGCFWVNGRPLWAKVTCSMIFLDSKWPTCGSVNASICVFFSWSLSVGSKQSLNQAASETCSSCCSNIKPLRSTLNTQKGLKRKKHTHIHFNKCVAWNDVKQKNKHPHSQQSPNMSNHKNT